MEFRELPAELKKGAAAAVYIVYGEEPYLRDRAVEAIRTSEPAPGFQMIRMSAPETPWTQIAAEAYTPPFLGGRKLVVISDERAFLGDERAALKAYAASPSPCAVLVIVTPSEKLPPLPASRSVRHVACRSPRAAERGAWIQAEFQRRGKGIDRAAAQELAERGGSGLAALAGHVEALALYAADRPRVTEDDVRALVRAEPEHEVYELALAAAAKRPARALEILRRLLAAGEAAPKLLWRLAWQYRKLVEAKKLLEAGKRRFEVTSALQITFFPNEFLQLVDRHTREELLEKHEAILSADVALKTTGGSEEAILEELTLRLATARAASVSAP
ncbi:MAG: DNA polymerase III subunit delta [Planctomycetes bacterium]|nr:DNA polymerase III subunit delta [Planctomycetota bacterium]